MDANHYTTNALVPVVMVNYETRIMLTTINSELQEAVEHLNAIHESVRVLQEQSTRVSSGLSNRQSSIVDENYQDAARRLDELMDVANDAKSRGIYCADETLTTGSQILRRVSRKTDEYLTLKIGDLGKKVSNLGALQQAVFLKLDVLFGLLSKYDATRAVSWKRLYDATARKFYLETYRESVRQFKIKAAVPLPPTPLIGEERSNSAPLVEAISRTFKNVFSTGNNTLPASLSSGMLSENSVPSDLVVGFTVIATLLCDLIRRESDFSRSFFHLQGSELKGHLKEVFARSVASFHKRLQERLFLATNLTETMQLYGKLYSLALEGDEEENIFLKAVMKMYVEYVASRVEVLIHSQIKSLDGAIKSVTPQTNITLVTRRFASLLANSVVSAGSVFEVAHLKELLSPLVQAVDKYLSHAAAALMNARSSSIFMINNYDYLVNYLEDARGKIRMNQTLFFELGHGYDDKLNEVVTGFVQEELSAYFATLFEFLQRCELGGSLEDLSVLTPLIEEFNRECAKRTSTIINSVVQSFSDYRTAVFVINAIFTQLLAAYQKFLDVHDDLVGKRPQGTQPVPMSARDLEQLLHQSRPSYHN